MPWPLLCQEFLDFYNLAKLIINCNTFQLILLEISIIVRYGI